VRALRCNEYGTPSGLGVEEIPAPEPSEGKAVVDVAAAALNFSDVLLVADRYQVHAPVPFTPGSEFAGTVRALGPGVEGLAVGDRVMGATLFGAFAEQVEVSAAGLQPVPPGIDLPTAAAFGVAYRTAYHALRSVALVEEGEWVVVLGAAGGVGLAAVELARLLGARVVAAASTPEKLEVCRAKGAVGLIDYTREDLKQRIRDLTGAGADVVIDPVGGPSAEAALRALRWRGRFVSLGFTSGEIPRIPLNLVLLKGVVVTGFAIEGLARNQPDDVARDMRELAELLASGRASPHISGRVPLEEAAAAMSAMAQRQVTGKFLIEPGP
jgi:NADPH:quinone reductase